jgi:hypothetical protein
MHLKDDVDPKSILHRFMQLKDDVDPSDETQQNDHPSKLYVTQTPQNFAQCRIGPEEVVREWAL